MKKIVLLAFVLVLLSTAVVVRFVRPVATSLLVHNIDTGLHYATIQEAINANETLNGHTILVDAGTYYEHVVVNKSISLIGENRSTTIIDGKGTGIVIRSNAPDVEIRGFTIQNGEGFANSGILVGKCIRNTVRDNIIRNNAFAHGIKLSMSNGCSIIGNKIMNNSEAGIHIVDSSNNTIHDNTIAKNSIGVWIPTESSLNNTLYHNNFIDNPTQAQSFAFTTKWDKGTEGNFWSDYTGEDLDSDGIGDTLLPHLDVDYYPLMGPISLFNAGTWNETTYYVHTVSNSTISDFNFNPDNYLISFNVTGPDDTVGFCRVTIPRELMWCDALEEWNVTVNSNPPTYLKAMEDADYTYLYFTYNHTIQEVQIKGIHVIPEFPTWTSTLLILIMLTVAIVIYKRRLLKTPIH